MVPDKVINKCWISIKKPVDTQNLKLNTEHILTTLFILDTTAVKIPLSATGTGPKHHTLAGSGIQFADVFPQKQITHAYRQSAGKVQTKVESINKTQVQTEEK